ncbi:hypothetical protein EJ05DRAFT_521630 [Pseudovirgaria hyperparasitica]|uniref:Sister chromatid separation protein-like protein n=1 Tax=Pseudovirgaria hyperparasitica TaxID=470096 RepID=A0A6A6VV57_9PEZI|nr:uncharacterized protein EJ05DRAFT_521630 [Pseudovirgaria hyperparasitica]KAF2753759.1 hypothetical protein EJ05DRAFT_521630 [Pseudovirgaria hyperparasitica]
MTTPDPDFDYLQPGFDPASVTVPRLRNILLSHDVNYPSSSKKPQLIDLFNEHVSPQAKRILSARSRTKRSTRGIQDVPSSNASVIDEEEDFERDITPVTTTRTSRRSRAAPSEEAGPIELPGRRTPARSVASKQSRQSSLQVEDKLNRRRTRMSATPATTIKSEEDSESESHQNNDEESPFTTDNPFQSGSSPLMPDAKPKRDFRRKTLDPPEAHEKRRSGASRRRTDVPLSAHDEDKQISRSSRRSIVPVSQIIPKEEEEDSDEPEAGEEFAPDAQLELEQDRALAGNTGLVPARRQQVTRRPAAVKPAFLSVLTALAVGIAALWRQEKLTVGYCGIGHHSQELAGVEIPEWADPIRPQCEPCPQHAYCSENLQTTCETDFILKEHPLSLFGIVPFPPTCEPDGEKTRKIKQVADRAVEELRERNAKYECGELKDDQGKKIESPAIPEVELKQTVSEKKRKGMSDAEFEDLWRGAIGEILGRDEITSTVNHRLVASKSTAKIGLSCALRRSLRVALARYIWQLVGLALFGMTGGYGYLKITSGRKTEATAKHLATYALDRLAQQAALHAHDSTSFPENWISMGQLRDDILRNEFSASRRQKLWERVQKKVEQNSNVRPMVREGRSGDVSRVWEWIGAVGALDSVPSSGRRQSSKYSLGGIASSSPAGVGQDRSEMEMKSWDEGRPIY